MLASFLVRPVRDGLDLPSLQVLDRDSVAIESELATILVNLDRLNADVFLGRDELTHLEKRAIAVVGESQGVGCVRGRGQSGVEYILHPAPPCQ